MFTPFLCSSMLAHLVDPLRFFFCSNRAAETAKEVAQDLIELANPLLLAPIVFTQSTQLLYLVAQRAPRIVDEILDARIKKSLPRLHWGMRGVAWGGGGRGVGGGERGE